MNDKTVSAAVATALGAAFSLNVAAAPLAGAANPFQLTELGSGYMVAAEGKCGSDAGKTEQEAKCGSNAEKTEKAEEGACGAKTKDAQPKDAEGKCAANKVEEPSAKTEEGKCGEGKCGSKA
jgi:uncharacterized low-complexity protein